MIERKTIHTLPIHSLADLQAFGMEIANSQMFGSLNPHQGTMVASILFQKAFSSTLKNCISTIP